ncbi:MAG TPA: TOBE-like domain-containing protein [Dongiaceae bacterium]|jgi:sulfate transport system ATP-binding protein|nr:TOBE-like domain-containing protein [Dongiaceae bacterium]
MRITLNGIDKAFAQHKVLVNVDLEVKSGSFVALLGPSGSGKTTLLRIIAGLDFPDRGSIAFDGADVTGMAARSRQVGFVFQHYALFKHMRVDDNIAFGMRAKPKEMRPDAKEISRRVAELLDLVQLTPFADRYPAQLSGGQKQRVALARALAIEPKVLLLDEPFGALDAKIRKDLRRWLRRLHDQMGLTSLFVTHDQDEALDLADSVVLMNEGQIEQVGSPEELFHRPANAFVCDFLGYANRLPCRVTEGHAAIGDLVLANAAIAPGAGAQSVAYFRPDQVWLKKLGDSDTLPAEVGRIFRAGPRWRIDLHLAGDHMVEAEMALDDPRRADLRTGGKLGISIRHARIFGTMQ